MKVFRLFAFAILLVSPPLAAADEMAPPLVYQVTPAATHGELTPANGWPDKSIFNQWTRSHGGSTGDRYSGLDQINKGNVKDLTVAWTYHSGDGASNIQCNPIIVDDVVIVPTGGYQVVGLDGATGKERWRFKPQRAGNGLQDCPARRGLIYWPGDPDHPARVIFTEGKTVYALDPKSGQPITAFGQNGQAPLAPGTAGCSVAPVIYKDVLIMPGFTKDCFGYDVRTGKQLWTFHTQPRGTEPGAETWHGPDRDGANCWGGVCLDESRGIAYFATGSPKPNFIGVRHTGDDLYSDCLIALDAATGKYRWHFQEIRHDVWDLDIPAPPFLTTVNHDGMKVDAVGVVTKSGNTLLCDRVSGKPLFPFRLRRAPVFTLPGDAGAVYQPGVELPQPFSRQMEFKADEVTDLSAAAHDAMMKLVNQSNFGWFVPFQLNKTSIYYGILGGAEWPGAAVDPKGRLFVTSNNVPFLEGVSSLKKSGQNAALSPLAEQGHKAFELNCSACHGVNREGRGTAPSLVNVGQRLDEEQVREVFKLGRGSMPPQPQLTEDDQNALLAFLYAGQTPNDGIPATTTASAPGRLADMGYTRLVFTNDGKLDPFSQHGGYPGCKPPWGTLTCLDLNTGRITWQVPFGEYPELTAKGIPKTGTLNLGGATATGSGLVFASGTLDNQIRAFDADNGEELWKHDLPTYGTAPPAVYEVAGREYVVLPCTGGGKLGSRPQDVWMAFALPR